MDLRKFFPKGEQGDLEFFLWFYGLDKEDLADEEASKNSEPISIDSLLLELEAQKQQPSHSVSTTIRQ